MSEFDFARLTFADQQLTPLEREAAQTRLVELWSLRRGWTDAPQPSGPGEDVTVTRRLTKCAVCRVRFAVGERVRRVFDTSVRVHHRCLTRWIELQAQIRATAKHGQRRREAMKGL